MGALNIAGSKIVEILLIAITIADHLIIIIIPTTNTTEINTSKDPIEMHTNPIDPKRATILCMSQNLDTKT